EIEMSAPGADWAVTGREASVAVLTVDGQRRQHVMLYAGAAHHSYPVFLGALPAGGHSLRIERDETFSAKPCGLEVSGVKFSHVDDTLVLRHAPILFARANTIGKFSDVPMIVYAERFGATLKYTVIFSNEDGGTSTRSLMARWGRTTDIEHVYVV